jgi:hypothetical protein
LFSFVAGQGIGNYISGGWNNAMALATNFTVTTSCAMPRAGCTGGMAASNVLFDTNFGYCTKWRLPALVAAEPALDDSSRRRPPRHQLAAREGRAWIRARPQMRADAETTAPVRARRVRSHRPGRLSRLPRRSRSPGEERQRPVANHHATAHAEPAAPPAAEYLAVT